MSSFLNYPIPVNVLDIERFEVSTKVIVWTLLAILAISFAVMAITVPSSFEPLISPIP